MRFQTKNNKTVIIRRLQQDDLESLSHYLENLSEDSKKRFGPHPFDLPSIIDFYKDPKLHQAYMAQTTDTNEMLAYAIVKFGILEADSHRYRSYGINLDPQTDCEFAPSVSDDWQSAGIGNGLFHFIIKELKKTAIKRIVLWGGVQADNKKAVNYYKKHGFQLLGQFSHHGENFDMVLEVKG